MRRLAIALLFIAVISVHAEDWGPLQFLRGEWVMEAGGGQPGQASAGSFSFEPDLQNALFVRRSFTEFPAANGRPAFRHDDLLIVFRNPESKSLRGTYWDNEDHFIEYSVKPLPGGVEFVSEGPASGLRYRLTYSGAGQDRVRIKFEIAPPGKDFAPYLEALAVRKK